MCWRSHSLTCELALSVMCLEDAAACSFSSTVIPQPASSSSSSSSSTIIRSPLSSAAAHDAEASSASICGAVRDTVREAVGDTVKKETQ